MPKRSSFISADSRQSSRTSQVRQTFLASLVDPPFSGKNASGSVCAHSARSCQPRVLGVPVEEKQFSHGTRPFDPVLHPSPGLRDPYGWFLRRTLWELHACRTPEVKPASGIRRQPGSPVPGVVQTGSTPWGRLCAMACDDAHHAQHHVLSGGMGGARFLQGLLHGIATGRPARGSPPTREVTVIANTADDLWVHGLKVCPDLDTVMYTLGDGIDPERGWGRRDETWSAKDELAAYGVEPTWFGLGDRDIATHLVRTQMLDAGYPLSAGDRGAVPALAGSPVRGRASRLLPMTDDRVETHVAIADPEAPSGRRVVHFQEYWVRLRAEVPAEALVFVGLDDVHARARRHRRDHRRRPGHRCRRPTRSSPSARSSASRASARRWPPPRRPVVGLSPIVGGNHVRGMAEQLLDLDRRRGQRGRRRPALRRRARDGGVLDGWLVDERDADQVAGLHEAGLRRRAVPLIMTDHDATAAMAAAAVGAGRRDARPSWLAPGRRPRDRRRRRPGGACWSAARSTWPTATSWWSPARWSARPRAGSARATATRRCAGETGARGGAARTDHDRPHPPRPDPGRGRRRRLQRRPAATSCCCRCDPDASARALRRRLHERTGRDRRRRRHRHRRPGLARGADRHRDRRRRAARRSRASPAATDATATRWRSRPPRWPTRSPAPPSWPRASWPAGRSRSCAAGPTWCCRSTTTAPAPRRCVRGDGADLFGYGAREAVLRALRGRPGRGPGRSARRRPPRSWPTPSRPSCGIRPTRDGDALELATDDAHVSWVVRVAAYAHGWEVEAAAPGSVRARIRPSRPVP